MKHLTLICLFGILFIACNSRPFTKPITAVSTQTDKKEVQKTVEAIETVEVIKKQVPNTTSEPIIVEDLTALQFSVALGISSQRPRWVLFENGTYIIFPEGYTDAQIKGKAIEMVSAYTSESITLKKSNLAKGWIGSTSKGIYIYVSQEDVGSGITDNNAVKAQALQNIEADKKELRVVHINSKKKS